MKKIFDSENIENYWQSYWLTCGKDTDRISSESIYPLYPACKYVRKSDKILECGCGLGRVLKHYFYQGYNIIGMELNKNAVNSLRKQDPSLPVDVGNVVNMHYDNNEFDMIMAFGVLSCIEDTGDMTKAVVELKRVLRDNGRLCCSVPLNNMARLVFRVFKKAEFVLNLIRGRRKRFFHGWCFTAPEFKKMLADNGFKIVEIVPSITRAPLYTFIPFFRKKTNFFSLAEARNGDRGYRLNKIGEFVFKILSESLPWQYAEGVVIVAEKKAAV